jgi:hypothetical protein
LARLARTSGATLIYIAAINSQHRQFEDLLGGGELDECTEAFETSGSIVPLSCVVSIPMVVSDQMPEMPIRIREGADELGITPRTLSR